jgi:hypothetical protein
LPLGFSPPVAPLDESPGYPGFCIFRPCRRWIFESPRISHPSALLAMKLRVAPNLPLPVAPADEPPGCPGDCIFRLCRRRIFELPRISRPSALPALKPRVAPQLRPPAAPPGVAASCPARRTFRLCLEFEFSGLPEFSLPRRRLMEHPSYPESRTLRLCRPCVFGLPRILHLRPGSMMTPGSPRTLHPQRSCG